MQLILMDAVQVRKKVSQIPATERTGAVVSSSFCVYIKPNAVVIGSEDNDGVTAAANDLISEITEGKLIGVAKISLDKSGSEPYKIHAHSHFKNRVDVLTNLWERFQEKVTVSLEIFAKTTNPTTSSVSGGHEVRCLSATGRVLNRCPNLPRKFRLAQTPISKCKFNANTLSTNSIFRVKVTADIPDELLIPNAHQLKRTNMKILEEGVGSDVVIEAANGVGIRCHKCFLVSTSSVFQRMFDSEMEESISGRIDMSDASAEGVQALLRHIYHGDMIKPGTKIDVTYDLLYLAHKYDFPKLEKFVKSYLIGRKDKDFSASLAFKIYSFVKGIDSASELKEKMVRIICKIFNQVKELPEFKEVFQKNPAGAIEICENVVTVMSSKKRKFELKQNGNGKRSRPSGEQET